jgi:FkbM family methyltransferase
MIPIPRSIARIPILRGLFRVALVGYARLTRGRYMVEERMGLRLLLDHDNTVDRQIFLTGTWEKEHLDTLFALVEEQRRHHGGGLVFLDIGAHWGLYALLAHRSGLFERIVAFEPDPTNYAQLQANLFLNGAETDIEALQLAASNRETTFGLYLRTQRNRGATRIVEAAGDGQVTCRAVRVDRQLDIEGKLLVVKMDVEGHELEAIEGMIGLLARNRCVFQVEVWDFPEGELARRVAILEELFGRYGMRCVRALIDDHFFVSALPAARTD